MTLIHPAKCVIYTAMNRHTYGHKAIIRRPGIAAALLIGLLALSFPAAGADFPLGVSDFRGKVITFDKPPQRVVCLIESALSGLFMLGAQDRVVGISTNIYNTEVFDYYAVLSPDIAQKKLPVPGNWDFVNIESVVALAPDLVVIWAHQTEAIAALEERGIRVFGVFIKTFDDIYLEMERFGQIFARTERATELVCATRKTIADFRNLLGTPEQRPGVYFMWAQGMLETSGKNSTVNDLITMAGGQNVCSHIAREHLVVNAENLLAWNPDVIVMWHNAAKDPQDVLQYPMWRSVSAVRHHRVYELPEVFACDFWTLKFQYAVKAMAKWCYPEKTTGLDLGQEKHRMFEQLYGNPLKPAALESRPGAAHGLP